MIDKVYIVIVTYNGMQWLSKCLESTKGHALIVVDNNSNDGTVDFIKANYPEIILLEQTENLGFGQANNIGISRALSKGAEYVFLLNQDAYLLEDALNSLVDFQKNNSEYGILSPIHINTEKDKLDFGFANYLNFKINPYFISDAIISNPIRVVYDVPFVNAAAWLISKSCIENVGGFDPIFFHYGEDINYSQRVIYHGFKIGVLSKNFVIHDRELRKNKTIVPYSEGYLKYQERSYKIKYADVNNDNFLNSFNYRVNKFKKEIIKSVLTFNFLKFKQAKSELSLLKSIKSEIIDSRSTNIKKGNHYINH
jgi:GT2 family glycosyltransferase